MARRALATFAAVLLLVPSATAAPDDVDEALAAFRERLALAIDGQARAVAVFDLAARKDARIAAELQSLLRHGDLEVRVAAARTLGEQGDPGAAAALVAAFEREDDAKVPVPAFAAALLEGIGEADARGRFKVLKKAAWKWLEIDLAVAGAAVHALALARTPEAVEECIALMDRAESRALDQTGDRWRNAFRAVVEQVRSDLARLTGKEIQTVKGWRDWWKENGKGWKPPPAGAASPVPKGNPDVWADAAETFSLRRPSLLWTLGDGGKDYALAAEARREGRTVARLWVWMQDVAGLRSQTAAAMAAERRPDIEDSFKEIAKEGTAWGRKVLLGGEKAVQNEVHGRGKDGNVCTRRYVYCVHERMMYFVAAWCGTSADDPLRKDLDALYASFRFRGK